MRARIALVVALAILAVAVGRIVRPPVDFRAAPADPALLHDALDHLTEVIVHDIYSPPQASRTYAYASVAAYEAMRPGFDGYRSLAGQLNGLGEIPAPPEGEEIFFPLAGVQAFVSVGRALVASQERVDSMESALHDRFREMGVPRGIHARSVEYGEAVARQVLAWAERDRFAESRGYAKYEVTTEAGRWTPTPPAYMDAVEPNWGALRPFVMDSAAHFRPAPPHPYDLRAGSPFEREVREVYQAGRELTQEQRAIAAFWDCNPYVMNVQGHAMFATKKISPGGHWMGIAGIAARSAESDIMASAEAYARTAVALADGFISAWSEKYRSNVIRPESVIQAQLDEGWQPLLQTPPFPEYTSGHSVISTAAARVLTDLFGEDFAFDDTTELRYGLPMRRFASFEAAAAEAAISRLYGGIHYRRAIEEGATQGGRVGDLVVERLRTRAPAGGAGLAVAGR